MLNPQRLRFVQKYGAKLFSAEGLKMIVEDPGRVTRTIKTFLQSKDLRAVQWDELFRDAMASVDALARLAGSETKDLYSWLPIVPSCPDTNDLAALFVSEGSDKASLHDYHEVYGSILHGKREKPLNILEVGLGTNNLSFQSSMGLGGRPGASVRAFRNWAPNAMIVGADIDRGILFEEERIQTFFVDQTDPAALKGLADQMRDRHFDLIIDDGLHLPHANLNTVEALLPLLANEGTMVIEDIETEHIPYWEVATKVLPYDTLIAERRGGWMFIIRNR